MRVVWLSLFFHKRVKGWEKIINCITGAAMSALTCLQWLAVSWIRKQQMLIYICISGRRVLKCYIQGKAGSASWPHNTGPEGLWCVWKCGGQRSPGGTFLLLPGCHLWEREQRVVRRGLSNGLIDSLTNWLINLANSDFSLNSEKFPKPEHGGFFFCFSNLLLVYFLWASSNRAMLKNLNVTKMAELPWLACDLSSKAQNRGQEGAKIHFQTGSCNDCHGDLHHHQVI